MVNPTLWSQLPFGDLPAWQAFLGDHARAHALIFAQAVALSRPVYETYPLGDGGGTEWLTAHHLEHRAICHSLGISPPPDLASYRLDDPEQWSDWMQAHADEHVRVQSAAGIV